jgi:pilus assembly protein FimV
MIRPAKTMTWIGGGLLALATLFSAPIHAAGLGKLTINSALGQPLSAEIELVSLQPGEFESMGARIASPDFYRDSKIEYASVLRAMRFSVDKRPNGQPILKITSIAPINEPFLDVLVELTWPAGRLLREYPILLDPPGFNEARIAPAAPAVATVAPVAPSKPVEPSAAEPSKPETTATATPAIAAPEVAATPSDTYGPVKKGDTLRKIADDVKPDSVSLEQMLVALYRENQSAFVDSNMNRLKAGQILRVPTASDVEQIAQNEAQKEIKVQVASWKAYKEGLASSVAAAPAKPETSNQASGKIAAPKPEVPAPAAQSKDVLKLSKVEGLAAGKAGSAGTKAVSTQDQIAALKEEAIARENALKEAKSRVADLEKQIQDMRKLMELKGISPSAAPAKPGAAATPPTAAKPDDKAKPGAVPTPAPSTKPDEKAKPGEPPKSADTKTAQVTPVGPAAKPAEAPKPAETAKVAEAKPAEAKPTEPVKVEPVKPPEAAKPAEPAKVAEAKPAPPKAAPAKAPAKAPPPEPDMMDSVMEYLPYVVGGLGFIAIGAGFFFFMRRRKAASGDSLTRTSSVLPSDLKPPSTTGKAAGGLIDTGNSSFLTDFDKTGPGSIDTDEVDPVAEAEVYIAYGRDAQAEEILKEAMARDKGRHEVVLKLLEIYHTRKSVAAFESLAKEFKQNVGETHPMWAKAAAMGAQIDPSNPLYGSVGQDFAATSSSMAAAAAPGGDAKHAPPDVDFDLAFTPTTQKADVPIDVTSPATGQDASFDLNLGPASTPAPHLDTTSAAAGDSGGLDFDIGFDKPAPAAAPAAAPAQPADSGGFDFDLSDLSTTKPATPPPDAHGRTAALNLTDISLDLDKPAPAAAPPAGGDGSSAVATKIELAKAYVEIGDKDGAKEILQEVLREGSAAQQEEAKSIIATL